MRISSQRYYRESLARTIEGILRSPIPARSVESIADTASFSRFHFSRVFKTFVGEGVFEFASRIASERAAFLLHNSSKRVSEIAFDAGYGSPEAFCRRFRLAFGVTPGQFRLRKELAWQLKCPSGLHWNPDLVPNAKQKDKLDAELVVRPPTPIAFIEVVGSYSLLSEGWEKLGKILEGRVPAGPFITVYLDNIWTHPDSNSMRAHIGFVWPALAPLPRGMARQVLPPGFYATPKALVPRNQRNSAWSYMFGTWIKPGSNPGLPNFDEYPAWPLPYEELLTKIFVGVASGKEN